MLNFIINSKIKNRKLEKVVKTIENYLTDRKAGFKMFFTQCKDDAKRIAKELTSKDCGDIVAVGGDGTVFEVLNGIENFDINLGIIPCGTGNDFCKAINISPKNIINTLENILTKPAKYTDFILVNDTLRVLNITGIGIDADVLNRYYKAKIFKGKFGYYLALVISLFKFKWNKYKIKLDGQAEFSKTAIITSVCNGKYFGGGMKISPLSKVDDGLLNVVIVKKIGRIRIPFAFISFMRGNILKKKFVEHIMCKSAELFSDAKPLINADGEIIKSDVFKCEVVSNKLKIFRP
ncbi:MAG: diacylglycerol kinase family lipid kinase [Firmicutes bacterium]|nr:diacylglycerol kinase family lipid kinase [Bacillota bacterium]